MISEFPETHLEVLARTVHMSTARTVELVDKVFDRVKDNVFVGEQLEVKGAGGKWWGAGGAP